MQQPQHDMRPFGATQATPRRFFSIGAVVLLHLALIYALATGLASHMAAKIVQDVQVAVVQEKPPEQKLPPPPPPEMVKPPPPFVPPPEINLATEAPSNNAITQISNTKAPPAPPSPTKLQAIGRTHTIPPYPAISVRMNQQGTVLLKVTIGTDGNVIDATVQTSSGFDSLDNAAIAWVKSHWKWEPPTQNGQPMSVSTLVAVKFDLKEDR